LQSHHYCDGNSNTKGSYVIKYRVNRTAQSHHYFEGIGNKVIPDFRTYLAVLQSQHYFEGNFNSVVVDVTVDTVVVRRNPTTTSRAISTLNRV